MQLNTRLATKEFNLHISYIHAHTPMRNRMLQEGYFSHEMVIISASPHLVYGCALEQRQRNPIRFLLSLKSRLERGC